MSRLTDLRCRPCEGGIAPLTLEAIQRQLTELPGWVADPDAHSISRRFRFDDFHETMAFVNAVAWIAHAEHHHPDLEVSYQECLIRYSTHAIGGLSENDLICAAKINAL